MNIRMINQIVLVLILPLSIFAGVSEINHDLNEWGQSLSPVSNPTMSQYNEDGFLPPSYISGFSTAVHQLIFQSAQNQMQKIAQKGCKASTQVTFPKLRIQGAPSTPSIEEFEDKILKIESTGCIKGTSVKRAAEIFYESRFRKKVIENPDLLQSTYNQQNGLLCEKTDSYWSIDATKYCMKLQPLKSSSYIAYFGNVVSNTKGYSPLYFRNNLVIFMQLPKNKIAVYLIMYAHNENINGFTEVMIPGKIKSTQKASFKELQKRLRGKK